MPQQQLAVKFPETINPEHMNIGEQYLLAVYYSDTRKFDTHGPFIIEEKPRRQIKGSTATCFRVQARMIKEEQRLPREELVLPLAGHSSLYGKKMSLHVYTDDTENYFKECNNNPALPQCQCTY